MLRRPTVVLGALAALCVVVAVCGGAEGPLTVSGKRVVRDFGFASGENLSELKLHYFTLGTPRHDEHGIVRNAVPAGEGELGAEPAGIRERHGRGGDGRLEP